MHGHLPYRTAALDGKYIATGPTKMSRFAQRSNHKIKKGDGTIETRVTWSLRVLRMVSTSTLQRLCFWQVPIPARTNEIGATGKVLALLRQKDKGRHMVELLTFDAGFLVHSFVTALSGDRRLWLGTLKENQPELLAAARQFFTPSVESLPEYETPKMKKDHRFYKQARIWRIKDIAGWETSSHSWTELKQVWCVEVIRYVGTGKGRGRKADLVEHDRKHNYFATSIPDGEISAAESLALVQSHWSIEDEVFNPLDCQWEEDCNFQHTTGEAALVLSFLRLMAMNACVMYRCRKERNQRWDGKRIWMPWQEVYDFIHRCLTGYYAAWVLRSEGLAAI